MQSESYFARYVAAAQNGRTELWRLVAGLILIFVVTMALALLVGIALEVICTLMGIAPPPDMRDQDEPVFLVHLLYSFILFAIGCAVALQALHDRPVASLFGWRGTLDLGEMAEGARASAIALLIIAVPTMMLTGLPERTDIALGDWLLWAPLVLAGILIQSGTEEVIFRGYLLQSLAARFRSPWVWAVLSSVLFGAAHFDVSETMPPPWIFIAATTIYGLQMAALVWATGGIGAAIGAHAANNVVALLLITPSESLGQLALYQDPMAEWRDWTVADGGFLIAQVAVQSVLTLWLFLARWRARNQSAEDSGQ